MDRVAAFYRRIKKLDRYRSLLLAKKMPFGKRCFANFCPSINRQHIVRFPFRVAQRQNLLLY
jgi:hypothetical protein